MAENQNWATRAAAPAATYDEGLRTYMLGVYNYMATGLAITGVVAFAMAMALVDGSGQPTELMRVLFGSPLKWVVMLAPLGMVFFLSARINKMSVPAAQATFWVFAGLMGLSLSTIFLVYTGASIAKVFFATAAAFGAMSLWGYTTKKDLTGMGSFLFIGVIGIIIASLINMFLQSSAMQYAISAIGILVFAGLTAYDTQKIKEMYFVGDNATVAGRKSIMGALRLYLDFVNMFLFMLQFMGNQK